MAQSERADLILKAQGLMGSKQWRVSEQSGEDWAGVPIGEALGLDLSERAGKATAKETINKWLSSGWLLKKQSKRGNGQIIHVIEVGNSPSISEDSFDQENTTTTTTEGS